MRIFWYQGGLHAEPETPEEGMAMRLLFEGAQRSTIGAIEAGEGPKTRSRVSLTSSVLEYDCPESIITDQ
jgi:hypothetical protein